MGAGTIDYKNLPEQKKVYGDKNFFISPLTLGIKKQYKAFIIRPSQTKNEPDFLLSIEGEFSMSGAEHLKEVKNEYENETVKFVYYEDELKDFPVHIQEDIKTYCNFAI